MIPPLSSTIVATVFITLLTILSCIQFRRSQTPLRLGAAVMALFGLSISALSIVYATDKLSLSVFWVYQFVAECISVTWVIVTIIHLGYAFYPLTRHQTLIWRTALGSVVLYDIVAIAELSYYCYGVWGSGTLSKEGTPILWIYWVRQVVKTLACTVTIAYLFVPLVRHHHSTGVAMIADSNTLAVGTWYLSALGISSLGYVAMFIYYMTRSKEVFSPQAQALDLCIRLIACPIFSLPPPQILINYFRKKYGSTARDDNPNTMIEEGITNNPQPRRPIMLVSQPTSYSRRDSAYIFDSTYQERDQDLYSSCSSFEKDDDRCTRYIDEEANIGTTSSLDTAAETSPRLKSLSKLSSANLKESKTPSATSTDEAASSSLSISIPSETRITFSPQEIDLTPPPLSFAPGLDLERNEQEETALAARRISRRLTMEGRKDDLDILNITSLMKRSNRASTGAGPKSQIGNSFLSLSTPMSESSFSPSRHFSDVRASVLKRGRQNMINDSPLVEEDEELDSRSLQEPSKQVATIESLERVGGQEYAFGTMLEHDTQMDSSNNSTSSRHPIAQQLDSRDSSSTTTVTTNTEQRGDYISNTSSPISNLSSSTSSTSLPTSSSSSPVSSSSSPISKKMSMDNIRKMSRDALTSFQKGVFGPALHNPILTSGPLSPTILRTEREAYGLSVKAKDGNNEHVEHV